MNDNIQSHCITDQLNIHSGNLVLNSQNKQHLITVLHQNIQSITNKIPEIETYIDTLNNSEGLFPNVLCFTETWTKPNNASIYQIADFDLACNYSRSKHNHGGVSIYVKKGLKFKIPELKIKPTELDFEFAAILFPDQKKSCCRHIPIRLKTQERRLQFIFHQVGLTLISHQQKTKNNLGW